jgi:non-heme chloroperoxidase
MSNAAVEPLIKSITLPERVRLQYIAQGDPAGLPVVLLHGITDSWHSYEPVLPHLTRSLRAYAITQRGHGDAERPATGYRLQDFAADVAAFMDALAIKQAVIVGHSMGSLVAQRFALDYPARTLGLALIGSWRKINDNPSVQEFWEIVSQLNDPIDPDFVREFQQSTLAKPVPETFFETVVQESLKVPARVWRAALKGLLENDAARGLVKIKAPTLIVWGDQDAFCTRGDQDDLAATIAGAQLVIYPGSGHSPQWEEPERFAADLAAFCETLVR